MSMSHASVSLHTCIYITNKTFILCDSDILYKNKIFNVFVMNLQ